MVIDPIVGLYVYPSIRISYSGLVISITSPLLYCQSFAAFVSYRGFSQLKYTPKKLRKGSPENKYHPKIGIQEKHQPKPPFLGSKLLVFSGFFVFFVVDKAS